jgi:hypothetical protein
VLPTPRAVPLKRSEVSDLGFCINQRCSKASTHELLERYPDAGQYCPECGELLVEAAPARGPFSPAATPVWIQRSVVVLAGVVLLVAVSSVAGRSFGSPPVRVCTTTTTERLGADLVQQYSAKNRWLPTRFIVGPSNGEVCDVRFWTTVGTEEPGAVLAHDAVVVAVNPDNPLNAINLDQLRSIFSGRTTNWSQLGGPPGVIEPLLPVDGTDEINLLRGKVLSDLKLGERVRRVGSSGEIVKFVAGPSGRRAVGLVAFSAAIPAKVAAIAPFPPPSSISIAQHSYPFSVRVMLESDIRKASAPARGLIAAARAPEGEAVVVRTGFVGKNGF